MSRAAAEVLSLRPLRRTTAPTAPPGFADALAAELAHAIIRLAAENPDLITRVRDALGGPGAAPNRGPLLLRKGEYAERAGYSVRTLDKLIDAGLPTRGQGKLLRVVVAEADEWLLSQEAGSTDDVDLLAMRNARKRAGRGGEGA